MDPTEAELAAITVLAGAIELGPEWTEIYMDKPGKRPQTESGRSLGPHRCSCEDSDGPGNGQGGVLAPGVPHPHGPGTGHPMQGDQPLRNRLWFLRPWERDQQSQRALANSNCLQFWTPRWKPRTTKIMDQNYCTKFGGFPTR